MLLLLVIVLGKGWVSLSTINPVIHKHPYLSWDTLLEKNRICKMATATISFHPLCLILYALHRLLCCAMSACSQVKGLRRGGKIFHPSPYP